MVDSAVSAFFTGYKQGATVLDEIREKKIDVEKKAVDLKSAQDTARRMQQLTEDMANIRPDPNKSPVDNAVEMLEKASVDATNKNLPEIAATAAKSAASISQSDAYGKSIKLQQHKQTLSELSAGVEAVPVGDDAAFKEFVQSFEKTHPPDNEFGSMGIFRDSNGQIYKFTAERKDAIRRGAMTAKDQVQMNLEEMRIKVQEANIKLVNARINEANIRAKNAKDKNDAMGKVGGNKIIPGDVKMIYEMAVADGYNKDIAKELIDSVATGVSERIPFIMKEYGISRSKAAKAAYDEAIHDKQFAGVPKVGDSMQIKGTQDKPRPMPMNKDGSPDLAHLKADTFVKIPPGFPHAGETLYWDGEMFHTPAKGNLPIVQDEDPDADVPVPVPDQEQ